MSARRFPVNLAAGGAIEPNRNVDKSTALMVKIDRNGGQNQRETRAVFVTKVLLSLPASGHKFTQMGYARDHLRPISHYAGGWSPEYGSPLWWDKHFTHLSDIWSRYEFKPTYTSQMEIVLTRPSAQRLCQGGIHLACSRHLFQPGAASSGEC